MLELRAQTGVSLTGFFFSFGGAYGFEKPTR
jgi:hypothetical protein